MSSSLASPPDTLVTRKLANYTHLGDIRLRVSLELGRKVVSLADAARLRKGDLIATDRLAGEPFDLLVNGKRFADGEVVVVTDIFACRITRMREP